MSNQNTYDRPFERCSCNVGGATTIRCGFYCPVCYLVSFCVSSSSSLVTACCIPAINTLEMDIIRKTLLKRREKREIILSSVKFSRTPEMHKYLEFDNNDSFEEEEANSSAASHRSAKDIDMVLVSKSSDGVRHRRHN